MKLAVKNPNNLPVNKICSVCSMHFHVKPSHIGIRKTCSRKCANILKSTYTGEKSATWKGGHVSYQGYKIINQKYEHRSVMERKLGRKLASHEIVHHIDHDKTNNHPDNLEILTRSEHIGRHFPEGLWRHRHANKST